MGSSLSLVVDNFFMAFLEHKALQEAPLKPSTFLRYVDDTFLMWSHGQEALYEFYNFMNKLHPSITFTMELEGLEGLSRIAIPR